MEDVNEAVERFFKNFREEENESESLIVEGKYEVAIKSVVEVEGDFVEVDACDVFGYDPDLYFKLVRFPLEVLVIFDIVLMSMVTRVNPLFDKHVHTRIFNLRNSTSMRNLNPSGELSLLFCLFPYY